MRRHKLKADRTIPLIRPIFWALTTATVTLSFLLWVISLFAFFPYRCMWLEEYYWVSEADFPPLYGVLFFVFFLTAWWMAAIAVSDVIQGHPVSRAELVAFATNGMVLLAVAVILWTLWGWISLDTEKKYELVAAGRSFYGPYSSRSFLEIGIGIPDSCSLGNALEGHWRVVELEGNHANASVASLLLWRNGTFEIRDAADAPLETGTWDMDGYERSTVTMWSEN